MNILFNVILLCTWTDDDNKCGFDVLLNILWNNGYVPKRVFTVHIIYVYLGLPLHQAAIRAADPRRQRTRAAATMNWPRRRRRIRAGYCRRARRGPVRTSRYSCPGRWAPGRFIGLLCTPSSSARTPTCPLRIPPCRSSRPYEKNWTNFLRRRIRTLTHPGDSSRILFVNVQSCITYRLPVRSPRCPSAMIHHRSR